MTAHTITVAVALTILAAVIGWVAAPLRKAVA